MLALNTCGGIVAPSNNGGIFASLNGGRTMSKYKEVAIEVMVAQDIGTEQNFTGRKYPLLLPPQSRYIQSLFLPPQTKLVGPS